MMTTTAIISTSLLCISLVVLGKEAMKQAIGLKTMDCAEYKEKHRQHTGLHWKNSSDTTGTR